MKSDPMYHKAIDVLEKQDRILAERRVTSISMLISLLWLAVETLETINSCFLSLVSLPGIRPCSGLLTSVGTAWANQFQLQSKYESIQDALKLLSAEHVQDGTLASFQLHKCQLNAELELLVHCLEATVIAYKFCDQQLNLVMAEIDRLCPDT